MDQFERAVGQGAHVRPPNGSAPHIRRGDAGPRMPTVNEALQFTPFSSIVPFNPDIIPAPLALTSLSPTAFGISPEVVTAKRLLDQLNVGAKRCQQTLRDVQKLLDPHGLTQYTFKAQRRFHNVEFSAASSNVRGHELSPFAKMVLDNTTVHYRYLTPESPESATKSDSKVTINSNRISTPNADTKPTISQNGPVTPYPQESPLLSQSSLRQAVVIPASLTPAQLAEYKYVPDGDSVSATKPLGTLSNDFAGGNRPARVDQKQTGDLGVQNLQSLLFDLFSAEDDLQADTSGKVAGSGNAYFIVRDTDDGSVPVLQPETQGKLESQLQKVIAHGRIDSVEVGHLVRIQRLCESAVLAVESGSFKIDEDWSEQDIADWQLRITNADRGLVAARTLMRIMSAGSHLKELQSEDFLRITLASLKKVTEACVVPLVEERPWSGEKVKGVKDTQPSNPKFAIAVASRKVLQTLLNTTTKTFRILGDFLTKSDVDEASLSPIVFLCRLLIFAENTSTEKDSVFGTQAFEALRRSAMDVLTKIFAKYIEQRQFLFDEIMNYLEKLPDTKQSARQYRLVDAKPIQLVSALLMRLVQTSATHGGEALQSRGKALRQSDDDSGSSDDDADGEDDESDDSRTPPKKDRGQPEDLLAITKPLHDAAHTNASYVVSILIGRALSTSKSGDEPYRRLLDIFTEDFLSVLGSSDWPSAEILLRTLVMHLIRLVENAKSTAASRYMAVELLGTMGAGILELQKLARNSVASIDMEDSSTAKRLANAVEQLETGDVEMSSLLASDGPYRMVIEYLQARDQVDAPLRSARGYHLMQWAFYVCSGREDFVDEHSSDSHHAAKGIRHDLRSMMLDPQWLEEHHEYSDISTAQGRLAAMVVTLSSRFCKAFNKVFSILLTSMSSEQSTIRSRSLKSVATLLETDPSILDRTAYVMNHISRSANDPSPLVRSSAISLFEKCTMLRPALDTTVYERVIARTRDAAVGVRKSAMNLLKKIYLRNKSSQIRSVIANAIIARIHDTDESVVEMARHTVEDIWFQPLHAVKFDGDRAVEAKLQFGSQAALFVQTIQLGGEFVMKVLESLLTELITRSKTAGANTIVCQTLIRVLFDGIIDNTDIPGSPDQHSILLCLTIFARTNAKLFSAAQIERLEPYTQNLNSNDDLDVYRSAVTILRHTIPHHSMLKHDLLMKLQTSLLTSIPRLPSRELPEVVSCLWTINGLVCNTERLVNFIVSVLTKIYGMKGMDLSAEAARATQLSKLMAISGQFGKVCDFDDHLSIFKKSNPWYKGTSVAGLIVEILCPFTSPKQPLSVREAALEAVCTVAQDWPKLYLRVDVVNAFETVFKDRIPALEEVLLAGLEGFFCDEDALKGAEDVPELGTGVSTGTQRLGGTYVATDRDGASTSMAQRFLPQILRLALSSTDEVAFIAAKLVVSINKHSFVLPKESAPALVALETCPNVSIASLAFKEHKDQHAKRESLFEKEYMRAVHQVFEYQRDVIGSPIGYTGLPLVAKMHLLWEVLKTGKAQVRKKFLSNMAARLDFNLGSSDTANGRSMHLTFVRFCVENLAFFEYDKVDEVLHLLNALEKVFSSTGTAVAQAIESELFRIRVDVRAASGEAMNRVSEDAGVKPELDPIRLKQLAVSSQICSVIWETRSFLRKVWNMQKHMAKPKNAKDKDITRAPTRASNAAALSDSYVRRINDIMTGAADEAAQYATCSAFVELISVDSEVKVESENDGDKMVEAGYDTPSEGTSVKSPSLAPSGDGVGKRRRSTPSTAHTPRKKSRPSVEPSRSTAKLVDDDDDDNDTEGHWD